jgi:hypothetical protein
LLAPLVSPAYSILLIPLLAGAVFRSLRMEALGKAPSWRGLKAEEAGGGLILS